MSALKTFYRHSSHYLGGRVAVMMLGFISFPLFTRVFSVAEYGAMSLILNTVALLTVLSKFGFQHAVQRYYPDYANSPDPKALPRYYSTLFFGTGFIALTLCAVFLISVPFGVPGYLGITAYGALTLALALVVVRSLRSMQMNLMQMENKTRLFNGMDVLTKALVIAAICLLLFLWKKSIFSFFLGTVIVETAVLLQYMPYLSKRQLLSIQLFSPEFFHSAVMFAFPLMTAEISWVVLDSGDRFFVQHYLGAQSLGFYSAAYGIATYLQDVMMAPLQLALFPICMKLWTNKGKAETQEFLSRSLDHFAMVAVGVVCAFMVTSRDVIVLLASKKFQQAHSLLPYLVIGLVLSAVTIYFRPGLLIHKKAGKIATATFGACLLNVAMNIILLPRIGLLGAAIATTVSYGAIVVFLGYESLRVLPFKIEVLAFLRYIVAGTVVAYSTTYLQVQTPLLSVLIKGTFVVTLYAAVLWLTDPKVRKLIGKAWQVGIGQVKQLRQRQEVPSISPMNVAVREEEVVVNQ
ncbi:MAG TPA: oligosaccharide flippase family protein [Candidatus Angelobacter sp.]|jgi:O-antigen/teichoic acid export membrane protein|nr:oligosaccharide flippase family protein [Candidatus Angelobacter sp.]